MIRFKATPDEKPAVKAAAKPAKTSSKAKATAARKPKDDLLDLTPAAPDEKD